MNDVIYKNNRLTAFLKRMFVVVLDFALFALANTVIVYITMNGKVESTSYSEILFSYPHFIITGLLAVLINYLLGLYKSVWTFVGNDEIIRGCSAAFLDALMLFLIDRVMYQYFIKSQGKLAYYAYIIDFLLLLLAIIAPRLGYRIFRRITSTGIFRSSKESRVLIVGAGFMGNFVIDALINESYKKGRPIVAVDDNPAKLRKYFNGVKVVASCEKIPEVVEKYNIDTVILCLPSASKNRKNELLHLAMQTKANVKISPSVEEMLEDGGSRKVRKIKITDLLSRPEIKLDRKVCRYLVGKTILVTGGGGSIGSEICMQVARYNPKMIIIFDIYENCAFELANELEEKYSGIIDINVRIGSVRDKVRLHEIFEEFHPDVVFHAAAHKHVPLMEDSPCEAVKNNVFGTLNVAQAADEFKVSKMVILSTDKAVNPTNVMGCTKRITEIIVQHMNKESKNTEYAAVRFGNVLGSHGSVIPIFEKQIANGGPVHVTHPDITRYFMTIPEAAQLVCQAGGIAKGGEIFVLDMGEPVKIMDLAKNMIRLSGYDIDEIGIEITGLRQGEKLYEELAMDDEIATRKKTANEKIFVNQPMDISDEFFNNMLNELKDINDDNVREKLMKFIPNYHPANNKK